MTSGNPPRESLRLWPGVTAATLMLLVRFGVPATGAGFEAFRVALLGGFLGVLVISIWWVFFSRANRSERWGATLLMPAALALTYFLNHESMDLIWLIYYGAPVSSLGLVFWAVASARMANGSRRFALVATALLTCAPWSLIRMDGLTGDHVFEFAWRWAETGEKKLLARGAGEPAPALRSTAAFEAGPGWPGFRGPARDSVIPGVRIETDWAQSPPAEVWRRSVGPGWSSFAVGAGLMYTQEQRGQDEIVACYEAATGELIWTHRDATRFFESIGGPGPRATPTLSGDLVFALGATGILNALDAHDGSVEWTRNVARDTESDVPGWGFSSSPLIVDGVVIVAASGILVGYDRASGEPRWFGPDGGPGYCSPHRIRIDGVDQILLLSDAGATAVLASDGSVVWDYPWPGTSLVQPARVGDADLLINAGEGKGLRRIALTRGPAGWGVEALWESNRLKPNFNDFVVHEGHAYGFDGSMLASIDLEDGRRSWKGGRYGHGQLVLLSDQDLLVVLSEQGELVLVEARPERFNELARFQAIEGKTWNHPALVGDLLLVRNGEEMAAFRLPAMGE